MPKESNYPHSFVALGRYQNRPFVTGSFESLEINNNATEMLDDGDENWTQLEEYPLGKL